MRKITFVFIILLLVSISGCSSDGYQVFKKNGQYYLSLGSKNDHLSGAVTGIVGALPVVSFDSVAEMKNDIQTGTFTDEEMRTIEEMNFLYSDSGKPMHLPNLDQLYEPVLPECYETYRVIWYGDQYYITASNSIAGVSLTFLNKEQYTKAVSACEYWMDIGAEEVYTIAVGDTDYYVRESTYSLEDSTAAVSEILVCGISSGQYFQVKISDYTEYPSAQFLSSFGFKPYS